MNSAYKRTKAFILSISLFLGALLIIVCFVIGIKNICTIFQDYESPITRVDTKEKKVAQISKDNNNILNIFDSIQSAERITNVAHSNILKCCKGERDSAGGYIWKYA